MKQGILISVLVLLANWSFVAGYTCPDTLIADAQTHQCGTTSPSRVFDSSSFTVSPGQKTLTIAFDVKVTDLCSLSAPQVLATASVGNKKLMNFGISSTNKALIETQTSDGTFHAGFSGTNTFPLNTWITMAGSFDIAANKFAGAIKLPGQYSSSAPTITGMIGPDTTMKISVCSDVGGTNRIGCEVRNFKVFYDKFDTGSLLTLTSGTEACYKPFTSSSYSASSSSVSVNVGVIIGIVIGAVAVVALVIGGFICYRKKMRQRRLTSVPTTSPQIQSSQMDVTRTIGQPSDISKLGTDQP